MFKVRELHQIELTSHCNLRCQYCPSRNLPRPKLHMTKEHFAEALEWVRRLYLSGTQEELNLAGIGESTMHPNFVEFVQIARVYLGENIRLVFATNGLLMTDELAAAIAPFRPVVFVSLHRPEKAGKAVEVLKKYGLLGGVSADPSVAATNWAGQVKWHVSAARRPCQWVQGGKVFMLADGRVSRCAYDATGEGVLGTISELAGMKTSPWSLCKGCDQDVGVPLG